MRPLTSGREIVDSSLSTAAGSACAMGPPRETAMHRTAFRNAMSLLLPEGKAPGESEPQLADAFLAKAPLPNANVERKIIPGTPDDADQPGMGDRASGRMISEDFSHRPGAPRIGAFQNRAEKKLRIVCAVHTRGGIEMQGHPFRPLRPDAGDRKAR